MTTRISLSIDPWAMSGDYQNIFSFGLPTIESDFCKWIALRQVQRYFSNILVVNFIGGVNLST